MDTLELTRERDSDWCIRIDGSLTNVTTLQFSLSYSGYQENALEIIVTLLKID